MLSSDPEVVRYIGDGSPWSEDRTREFVERQRIFIASRGYGRWKLVRKDSGAFAGFCGIGWLQGLDDPEIGWWLSKDCWGQGLATEAARVALRDGLQRVQLPRIVSIAQAGNAASIRIMEKLGMTREREFEFRGVRVAQYAAQGGRE